jgi:hypothetical protein
MVQRIDIPWIRKVQKRLVSFNEFQRTSLDSHADTCCAGSNMAVFLVELTGEKQVNVYPFSNICWQYRKFQLLLC